jgi:predicted ATPase/class 3 adenylate cyclase
MPSGAVAFLFTDVEGSTQRWEQHHDAMDAAIRRHDAMVRAAIEQHDGHVFKTVGDAFCAAFSCASDATAAAVDAQRALANEDFSAVGGLRIRVGLHVGEAAERNSDFFGPAVNRVARLMSIGHGGQVLMSGSTRELVGIALPSGTSLIDLGMRRLKDLTEPERVWQLTVDGLPSDFPPLNSLDARPNNLPEQLTALVGRENDLKQVKTVVVDHRLVTLFGSGGVGKTRVALQIGADLIDRYADGAWFSDLAPIRDPELVASVVAKALSITAPEDRSLREMIPLAVKNKKMLLILDNCEQVVEAAASLAEAMLTTAPGVSILATSRQALGISGEAVYRLPSLSVPDVKAMISADEALDYGALALFIDRAKAADNRFALTDANAPIAADICRRLDGIPLAIELAAARVRMLSIPNINERLNERFKILTGGSRTALPRQKTLEALIDWSYGLLDPNEQKLFNRLGIFAGGFSLDAAAAVCAGDAIDAADVFDLLASLTDKSLVLAEIGHEQERFRLLETTRAYALEKLAAAGERDLLARRHGEYYRDEAQAADLRFGRESTAKWLSRVLLELDNYRTALAWSLTDGCDAVLGGAVAASLERLWSNGGLSGEGRYWLGRAQEAIDESVEPHIVGRVWLAISFISDAKRKRDAAAKALSLLEREGDNRRIAWALLELGDGYIQMNKLEEAGKAYAGSLELMRGLGERHGAATAQTFLGWILFLRGDAVAGRAMLMQALENLSAVDEESWRASALTNLAEVEFAEGHVQAALLRAADAISIHVRGKNIRLLALNYNNSAAYYTALGDLDGARSAAQEALRWARQAQYLLGVAVSLQYSALVQALRGREQAAARILGYVTAQFEELGYVREPTELWAFERLMGALRERLTEAEIEALASEGATWSEERAVDEALRV